MKFSRLTQIPCIALIFTTTFLHAAESTNDTTRLPEVVVREKSLSDASPSVRNTPGGAETVSSTALEQHRLVQLKDALSEVPGIYIQPRQGAADESTLSIRGSGVRNNFHLRGINLYLDGMLSNNADGFSDFDTLELLAVDHLDVFKGANGLEYGANALGGGINFVSKTGLNAPLLKIRAEAGSFGFVQGQIESGMKINDQLDSYLSITARREDGYRQHQDLERERLYTNLGWSPWADTLIRFYMTAVNARSELGGNLTKSQLQLAPQSAATANVTLNQRRDTEVLRPAIKFQTAWDGNQSFETYVYYQWKDLDHPLAFAWIDNELQDSGIGFRYVNTSPLLDRENEFIAGLNPQYGRILDTFLVNSGGSRGAITKNQVDETWNVNSWVQDTLEFVKNWKLIAGSSFQWSSRILTDRFLANGDQSSELNYTGFSPRIGLLYDFRPEIQFYGNLSMAQEPPTFGEQQLSTNAQLVNLAMQKSYQMEIGSRGTYGPAGWDLSLFRIDVEDELFQNTIGNTGQSLLSNIPKARHQGVELGGYFKFLEGLVEKPVQREKDYFKISTTYNLTELTIESDGPFTNKRLPGLPETYWKNRLSYHHPIGFECGFSVETVPDAYFVDKANTLQADGFTTFGVDASMRFSDHFRIFGEVRNLTDVTFASAVSTSEIATSTTAAFKPADGFAAYAGLEWTY